MVSRFVSMLLVADTAAVSPENGALTGLTPFLMRHSFFGKDTTVDVVLKQMELECSVEEKLLLQEAFSCPICNAYVGNAETTTICDQMRSVERAFKLIDTDDDNSITIVELEDIWAWSTVIGEPDIDEFITDFQAALEHVIGCVLNEELQIRKKDFLLAFAHCLCGTEQCLLKTWNLKKRHTYYRKLGRLFGIESAAQRFRWSKFCYAFVSDTLAFITIPSLKLIALVYGDPPEDAPPTFYDKLTEAQWLPPGYTTFESFHSYLAKLWVPSLFSAFVFFCFRQGQTGVGVDEILHPILHYIVIGCYISTLSGYEPQRMVLRRLNQVNAPTTQAPPRPPSARPPKSIVTRALV